MSTVTISWRIRILRLVPNSFTGICLSIPFGMSSHCCCFPRTCRTQPGISAIAGYDTLLTFSREIDCIWTRKPSIITALFIMSRYCYLLRMALIFWYPSEIVVHVVESFIVAAQESHLIDLLHTGVSDVRFCLGILVR